MSGAHASATARLLAACDAAAARADAFAALRRAGREAFAASGLPDTAREEWRYTNLAPLGEHAWEPAPAAFAPVVAPAGVELFALRDAAHAPPALGALVDAKAHPLAALASALFDDALAIRSTPNARPAAAVTLALAAASGARPTLRTPRLLVEARRGSELAIVLDLAAGAGAHYTNALIEVDVEENARVSLTLIQREHAEALHTSLTAVRLARDARFASRVVTLGGRLVRNDLCVLLAGEGAECALDGLYLGSGERVVDNHSLVDHAVPHCASRQRYKGVLGGASRGVFRGRVIVRPDAQQTNAAQSNPNLLLSDTAEIDSLPQLEIYADDVKCSHGTAIGRLDENALFYLRSRGLDEREARALLTRGFAAEILDALPEPLRGECSAEFARHVAADALA